MPALRDKIAYAAEVLFRRHTVYSPVFRVYGRGGSDMRAVEFTFGPGDNEFIAAPNGRGTTLDIWAKASPLFGKRNRYRLKLITETRAALAASSPSISRASRHQRREIDISAKKAYAGKPFEAEDVAEIMCITIGSLKAARFEPAPKQSFSFKQIAWAAREEMLTPPAP